MEQFKSSDPLFENGAKGSLDVQIGSRKQSDQQGAGSGLKKLGGQLTLKALCSEWHALISVSLTETRGAAGLVNALFWKAGWSRIDWPCIMISSELGKEAVGIADE